MHSSSHESQTQNYANVNERQDRKGVTERFMYYVPQVEHLLGPGQEKHSLRCGCFLASHCDSALKVAMSSLEKSAQGGDLLPEPQSVTPQRGDSEHPDRVQHHHVRQRDEDGHLVRGLLAGQT